MSKISNSDDVEMGSKMSKIFDLNTDNSLELESQPPHCSKSVFENEEQEPKNNGKDDQIEDALLEDEKDELVQGMVLYFYVKCLVSNYDTRDKQ